MARFKVACKSIRWNRKTFHAGEYLPESFTEKDKYRVLYPSRIIKVDEEVKETVEKVPKTAGTKKRGEYTSCTRKTNWCGVKWIKE